jgi:CRISPR-associated protein (TIGR03986 family)
MAAQYLDPPQAGRSSHPFRFVPVRPDLAVTDTPVGHDSLPLNESLLSGELQCTIKALTPLHVGWKQTEHDGRKLIMPLTLGGTADRPGPVLIPGSTLHGMLRHALGALLSAPMERVAERTASFRPNAQFPLGAAKWANRAAIVVSRSAGDLTSDSDVLVELIDDIQEVALLRPADRNAVLDAVGMAANAFAETPGPITLPAGTQVRAEWQTRPERTSQLCAGRSTDLSHHILLRYQTGIDGQGLLAEKFGSDRGGFKVAALVKPKPNRQRLALPAKALTNLLETLDHLASAEHGHLRDHPSVGKQDRSGVSTAVDSLRKHVLSPGDLIFLEVKHVDRSARLISREIIHILPTFRWRVRYRDTVQLKDGVNRAALMPIASELAENASESNDTASANTAKLSGARLLFGYNADPDTRTEGIGIGHFGRLAGRISANFAIERDPTRARRFVTSTPGINGLPMHTVALRPQGSPKATAPEHYVAQTPAGLAGRQDRGTLVTWGDSDEKVTGDLAGRKFYLHQPDMAEEGNWKYFEFSPKYDSQAVALSPLLRLVSSPSTEFRFALKFRNLRPWELGALLFALAPTPAAVELLGPSLAGPLKTQQRPAGAAENPVPPFAHKLGRGRAYGLGSVQIAVSGARVLTGRDGVFQLDEVRPLPQWTDRYLQAFGIHVAQALGPRIAAWRSDVLANWLDVLRFQERDPVAGYPSLHGRPARDGQETLAYHTGVRASHLKGRKSAGLPRAGERYGILPEPKW